MTEADPLYEVREATKATAQSETRRLATVQAAFDAGWNRDEIAKAAGFTSRDGLYKYLSRHQAQDVMRERYPFGPSRLGALGKAVHHIDGDPTNNDPSNLQIVDLNENTATKEQQP